MLKIYGSMLCPDCVACREALDKAEIPYEYFDFSEDLLNLKIFLSLRDRDGVFTEVKAEGKIGIPCILDEEGNLSFTWDQYLK